MKYLGNRKSFRIIIYFLIFQIFPIKFFDFEDLNFKQYMTNKKKDPVHSIFPLIKITISVKFRIVLYTNNNSSLISTSAKNEKKKNIFYERTKHIFSSSYHSH